MSVRILIGDCRERLLELPDGSVDSCVTDPPYHLTSIVKRFGAADAAPAKVGKTGAYARASRGFMGQQWDGGDVAFDPATWAEVLRVLKPGAHLIAFSGTRTYHRMACAIEDAGFEIRDQLAWCYGSGFPKSHNQPGGWGTALKPAFEPICFAQKSYTPSQFLATLVPTIGSLLCKVGSFEKTDTPLFGLLRTSGFLNIAPLLSTSLGALLGHESKCTIETATALTTDLKTLKSSLSRITQAITTGDMSLTNGVESAVWVAAAISRNAQANCERLTSTTAGEIVIDWRAPQGNGPEGKRLSPNWEPIALARKSLQGTVAGNMAVHGTGALNIDGCRIEGAGNKTFERGAGDRSREQYRTGTTIGGAVPSDLGRWPANIIHDGSDEVLAAFPHTSSGEFLPHHQAKGKSQIGTFDIRDRTGEVHPTYGDEGSAARFFYCAKADGTERHDGCHDLDKGNSHPTVKPVDLMRWLVRLVTPKGGTVLDPFAGSGSTLIAADAEQFDAIGCELSPDYAAIAERRVRAAAGMFAEVQAA